MALINGISREITAIVERIVGGAFKAIYVHGFRYYDRLRLRNYTDDIVDIRLVRTATSGTFAVFVYYEPNGKVSNSVSRIITELYNANVNIVLAVNHSLSDDQTLFFDQKCHSILFRGNQGFDFGCFKDAIHWMRKSNITPDRLILLNDSNFYMARGLPEFISGLLGKEDVIAAFENWGEGYHLQSFALSVSSELMSSDGFEKFWKKYVPSNNRVLAIEMGEKKLSATILKVAKTTKVLYPVSALYSSLMDSGYDPSIHPIAFCQPWRGSLVKAIKKKKFHNPNSQSVSVTKLCELINITSPIHSGAYFFPKFLYSPLIKKDLVYRGRFAFWEIDAWSQEFLFDEERLELTSALRTKGDYSQLKFFDKLKFRYGLK
jgi:hypothetical protein